jgi:carboxypeptidase Taq
MASADPANGDGTSRTAAAALRERLSELADLGTAVALLGWDRETVMPERGAQARGELTATLERLAHERAGDPGLGELIAAAQAEVEAEGAQPGPDDAVIARIARRDHDRATRIPGELVVAIARVTAEAIPAWMQAREESDFERFRPHLERQVELRREVAACFPEAVHPYDALLDSYEPGATTASVRDVFARLRDGLVPLVEAIAERPAPPDLPGPFDVGAQRTLALEIARTFGFEDDAWRIDDAVHPFAQSIARTDVRVTARWDERDLSGIFAVMHEVGHGLYEAGVDPALDRTTLGTGVSLGIHESQSRTWENQVGRSLPFWEHWYPRAQELFGATLADVSLPDFHRAVNRVRPTLIRVDADEATYGLHVILRFELEVALIEGTLAAADVPAAWNERMRDMLGVEVPDDRHGCLQDIHWSYGELGYFPTYALGNVVAGQLWAAARAALPDLDASLAAGDCAPLRQWLRANIHHDGRRLDPPELVRRATGGDLDPGPLLDYLRAKYGALYGL